MTISVVFLLIALLISPIINNSRTPFSAAEVYLGYSLPKTVKIKEFKDEWEGLVGGEQTTYIHFSYDQSDESYIIEHFKKKGVLNTNKKTDIEYFSFPSKKILNDFEGFYKYEFISDDDGSIFRNFQITIFNIETNDGYIYFKL